MCQPQTEAVLISNAGSIVVNHTKKRGSKKKKVNRIELSPPPVRQNKRSRRRCIPDTEDTEVGETTSKEKCIRDDMTMNGE